MWKKIQIFNRTYYAQDGWDISNDGSAYPWRLDYKSRYQANFKTLGAAKKWAQENKPE